MARPNQIALLGMAFFFSVANCVCLARGEEPKELPNQITPEAVRAVKKATVYLKVTSDDGQIGQGSGFLVGESGVVITNAHVLGMLHANGKPPTSIEVIVHSGEPDEMKRTGKLLGVDLDWDLAVLRVEGKLPAHLQLELTKDLIETQKVYIFGFPFGAKLGKNITVSESSVSSLRKNAGGTLEKIQVNGGMHPGNSGGPVVNSVGKVIGVSSSGIRGTQINFAIPAQSVRSLLDGRILNAKAGEPFRELTEVRVPLRYDCLDPLKRIRELRVEIWSGRPTNNRRFSPKRAQPETGDGPRRSYPLKIANGSAVADVPLPKLAEGQVAWVQPVVVLTNGEAQWGSPRSFDPALALDRKAADLTIKFAEKCERTVHLKSSRSVTILHDQANVNTDRAELDILESITAEPRGAEVRTAFSPAKLTLKRNGGMEDLESDVAKLLQSFAPAITVGETNKIMRRTDYGFDSNTSNAPLLFREQAFYFRSQIYQAVDITTLIMPNRLMQPGGTWQAELPFSLISTTGEMADLILTCTYEGSRTRSGNQEALATFAGKVQGRFLLKDAIDGHVTGKFTFDPIKGFISWVQMNVSYVTPSNVGDTMVVIDTELTRVNGNPGKLKLIPHVKKDPVVVKTVAPKPIAKWTFQGDARDSLGSMRGKLKDGATIVDGRLRIDGTAEACLEAGPLPFDIAERTLEAWLYLPGLDQSVYVMQIEDGSTWDGIVYAEQQPKKWYPGSSFRHRSQNLDAPEETAKPDELVHVAIVYSKDGSVTMYRNGKRYGAPFRSRGAMGRLQTYKKSTGIIRLGHTDPVDIKEARLYERALTAEEIAESFRVGISNTVVEKKDPVVVTKGAPKPLAKWTFQGDARDSIGSMHGKLTDGATIVNGRLRIDGKKGACLEVASLPFDITERTLEAWVYLPSLDRLTYVMSVQDGSTWDGIVFAEQQPKKWYPASSFRQRSRNLDAPEETAKPDELIHVAVVYSNNGYVTMYRNGKRYGAPFQSAGETGKLQAYKRSTGIIRLGQADGNPSNPVDIKEARLYNRALTAGEIAESFRAGISK